MLISDIVNRDFKPVDKKEDIRSVLGYLTGSSRTMPIVFDGKRPWGTIERKTVIKNKLNEKNKIEKFVNGLPVIDEKEEMEKAVEVLLKSGTAMLLVSSGETLVGYVHSKDLLAHLDSGLSAKSMMEDPGRIKVMRPEDSIGKAINGLTSSKLTVLPVVSAKGRLEGIIGIDELLKIEMTLEKPKHGDYHTEIISNAKDLQVAGFMQEAVPCCLPDDSLGRVAELIRENGYAVVADGDAYVGMITPDSVLKKTKAPAEKTVRRHFRQTSP
ncbi:MAG: hypothetical protein CVT48_02345 [Thermoplasmata archaeon HGW-Thermoplasmata-1]|nr:MAG: hypothetical protein CVT48_02345 [Thermoplasmata archaeon HGW-Thermoplasmata-1]